MVSVYPQTQNAKNKFLNHVNPLANTHSVSS